MFTRYIQKFQRSNQGGWLYIALDRIGRIAEHTGNDQSLALMLRANDSLPAALAHLRSIECPVVDHRILAFDVEPLDRRLASGGLRARALHEVAARSCSLADDAAATLFLAGIAAREARAIGGPVLWASCRADLYAPGLEQAGLVSANVIYAQPKDDAALLAVVEDAVRDGTPSAIVAEAGRVSMVATRRLQLVAADADMPVLAAATTEEARAGSAERTVGGMDALADRQRSVGAPVRRRRRPTALVD